MKKLVFIVMILKRQKMTKIMTGIKNYVLVRYFMNKRKNIKIILLKYLLLKLNYYLKEDIILNVMF